MLILMVLLPGIIIHAYRYHILLHVRLPEDPDDDFICIHLGTHLSRGSCHATPVSRVFSLSQHQEKKLQEEVVTNTGDDIAGGGEEGSLLSR